MNLILGIGLIIIGAWIARIQSKKLLNGVSNTLGGVSSLFIVGLGCIACGIIMIIQVMV